MVPAAPTTADDDPATDPAAAAGDPAPEPIAWTIIVPLKSMPAAKSRLVSASTDARGHARLVEAIRSDTMAAAARVGRLLVVRDAVGPDPAPGDGSSEWPTVIQSSPGLNTALREAAAVARERWPAAAVAALVADLPALTSAELARTLAQAARYPRGFVADATGTGTTMLTARPGVALDPAFGPGSAARHARTARALQAGAGLRLDVDTARDLAQARELGVGPATRALLDLPDR